MVEIAELGDAGVSAASIGVLGNEPLIGRNIARRFRIIQDWSVPHEGGHIWDPLSPHPSYGF